MAGRIIHEIVLGFVASMLLEKYFALIRELGGEIIPGAWENRVITDPFIAFYLDDEEKVEKIKQEIKAEDYLLRMYITFRSVPEDEKAQRDTDTE